MACNIGTPCSRWATKKPSVPFKVCKAAHLHLHRNGRYLSETLSPLIIAFAQEPSLENQHSARCRICVEARDRRGFTGLRFRVLELVIVTRVSDYLGRIELLCEQQSLPQHLAASSPGQLRHLSCNGGAGNTRRCDDRKLHILVLQLNTLRGRCCAAMAFWAAIKTRLE